MITDQESIDRIIRELIKRINNNQNPETSMSFRSLLAKFNVKKRKSKSLNLIFEALNNNNIHISSKNYEGRLPEELELDEKIILTIDNNEVKVNNVDNIIKYEHAGSINVINTKSNFEPFPHQKDALDALSKKIIKKKKYPFGGLLVFPTGGGKTKTSVFWLLNNLIDNKIKVLWIAHRHELLNQAFNSFKHMSFSNILPNISTYNFRIISGMHDKSVNIKKEDDLIIASKDSLYHNIDYLNNNWLKYQDEVFLIIDEAHHATAKTYRKVIDNVKEKLDNNVRILGLTATPFRTSENETGLLKKIFTDDILYKIDLRTLITRGILSEPHFEEYTTQLDMTNEITDADIKKIKSFDLPENLATKIAKSRDRNHLIVKQYIENKNKYKQTLLFALNREHAIMLNGIFNEYGIKSDYVISDVRNAGTGINTATEDNQRKINLFRDKKLNILINVNILTEGVDIPNVQSVFLTRPTISSILMTQMIGRGLRGIAAGGTKESYIVSFIDDWKDKINWVNPKKIIYDEIIDPDDKPQETQNNMTRLISISKMEEFAKIMDQSINTSDIEKVDFIKRLPIGIYSFKLLIPSENEEEIEKNCEVLVYDNHFDAYRSFIQDLENIFRDDNLQNKEHLDDDELKKQSSKIIQHYFSGCELLPAFREDDLEDILQYYAQKGVEPAFLKFENRDKCDISKLANDIFNQELSDKKKKELINSEWENEEYFWKILFGHNKEYFIRLINIEIEKITWEDEKKEESHYPDNVTNENRDITKLPLHEIKVNYPEQWKKLTDNGKLIRDLYKNCTDKDGNITCKECGFKHPSKRHFQIDHIKPMSKGGLSVMDNLQILCIKCNSKKSNKM